MYSTRCSNCRQPINLKPEEVQAMIADAEAKNHVFYSMPCPKCRRPIKIQVRDLKRSLPQPTPENPESGGGDSAQ